MVTRTTLLAAAALLALAGCNEATGPENFAPMATSQKVDQAFGAVDDNKAVQSMDVMSSAFSFTGAAPPAYFGASPTASAPTGIFPCTACLGKTFVYNTQTGRYEPSGLAGAPANGIRYLLYAVDADQDLLIIPLQQIGYLDLTDKSSSAGNTVGIKAVINDVTVLDYDASGSISGGSLTFGAKGNVTDAANRLDFDLSQSVSSTGDIKVDYKITAPHQDNMSVQILLTGKVGGAATSTLTVTESGNKLEVSVTGTQAASTGTVKYNGKTFATMSQAGSGDPVFVGANGKVLTTDDLAGLKRLFDNVEDLFQRFDDLLVPSYFVFGIPRSH
jgi:hypothetical protein